MDFDKFETLKSTVKGYTPLKMINFGLKHGLALIYSIVTITNPVKL